MAGEIQLSSTSFASESGGTITINNATLASAVDLSNHYASTSEVQGTHPTGTITTGTNSLTVSDATGINVGDYVTGEGIAPGTTVSAVSGTSITLSGTVGATLSSDPVSFYKADKVLSPGLVAGGLCRAWGCIDGSTDTFRSAFNVSSISLATNVITVNFTTNLPDTDFVFIGTSSDSTFLTEYNTTARGVGSVSFISRNYQNASSKPNFINIAIFR